jgi:alpha-beta hydrolase superfamily lysophospholipase
MVWIVILIVIAAIFLFLYIVGQIFYEMVLNAKHDKEYLTGPLIMDEKWQQNEAIFREYHPKDVFIENKEGLSLHAIMAQKDPDRWVILVHGYMGRNAELVDAADRFLEQGYSVLMPNLRCHARSEGDTISMGYWESKDLKEWIDYIVKEHPNCEIFLLGISMGAATVMMTVGKNLPSNVKAACEDCGYTSAWDEFAWQLKKIFHLPKFPILYAAEMVVRIRGKYPIREANPLKAVQKSHIPILFIHGTADDFVPTHMVYKLYNYANYPKELCLIDDGEHAIARFKDPEKYYTSVLSWFSRFSIKQNLA